MNPQESDLPNQFLQQLEVLRSLQMGMEQGGIEYDKRGMHRIMSDLSAKGNELLVQLEQFKGLAYTSALVTSSLDFEEVLNGVIDTIIHLTRAARAYVMLYEGDESELVIRAARNWDQETLSEIDIVFSRHVTEYVLEHGEAIITTNAQTDARFRSSTSIQTMKLLSIMCVPLQWQNKTVGVFYADNPISAGVFPLSILPLMRAFANHVAIAISNARRYEAVKTDLEEARLQMHQLQIQLDQAQIDERFAALSETDYFKRLEQISSDIRDRFGSTQAP